MLLKKGITFRKRKLTKDQNKKRESVLLKWDRKYVRMKGTSNNDFYNILSHNSKIREL